MTNCRMKRWAVASLAVAASFLASGSTEAAGLLVADGGFGGQLKVTDQNVRVVINNGIAVTEVEQVFQNEENRIVEALYTFPVPKNASVSNFSMWIGGKEIIGEVVEKKRARQIYESYKQTKRDPGLLEQVDFKRFEMRIFRSLQTPNSECASLTTKSWILITTGPTTFTPWPPRPTGELPTRQQNNFRFRSM